MMPEMDGVETFRKLREEYPGFTVPVIALSANAVSGTEERLLNEGFAAYITKPVQAHKLEEIIASQLAAELVSAQAVFQRDWASPELKETLSRELGACGVCLSAGLSNTGGDLSLLASLAEVFVKNYPESLARVEAVFNREDNQIDFNGLSHHVHSLKSSAGYAGAVWLSSVAERVERGCKDGDADVIRLAMPLLFMEWARARNGLMAYATHTRAVEPKSDRKAGGDGADSYDPHRLAEYIERRIRRKAIREIDKLIGDGGGDFPPVLAEVKEALRELDFSRAKTLLAESGVVDSSASDSRISETGVIDSSASESGASDSRISEPGAIDSGAIDSGVTKTGGWEGSGVE